MFHVVPSCYWKYRLFHIVYIAILAQYTYSNGTGESIRAMEMIPLLCPLYLRSWAME